MSGLTKTLLVIAIINLVPAVLFLTGLVNISSVPGLYVTFPLAAIFFGLFLLSRMLQKEVAAFDAEQRAHRDVAASYKTPESIESAHGHEHHVPIRA